MLNNVWRDFMLRGFAIRNVSVLLALAVNFADDFAVGGSRNAVYEI